MLCRYTVFICILFAFSGCGSHKRVYYPVSKIKPVPHASPSISSADKTAYTSAVNQMRAEARKCGNKVYAAAKPLKWSNKLYLASYEHSKDMAMCSYFGHKGSGTKYDWTAKKQSLARCSSFVNRIENNGYTRHRGVSENIAYGIKDYSEVIQKWMHSPGHCKNIMNPTYTAFGMAKVTSVDGTAYWTQNFGATLP